MTAKTAYLIGATGMLGQAFMRHCPDWVELVPLTRASIDLENKASLQKQLEEHCSKPNSLLINCAAYTQVDQCETEVDLAYTLNAQAPEILASFAKAHTHHLVHFSTDYVFDGTKAGLYTETDIPNPLNIYGKSKLAGEKAIQDSTCNAFIFRVQWLYGSPGNHFIRTILQKAKSSPAGLQIVNDQWGAPSWVDEIAQAVYCGLEHAIPFGLYHLANREHTTWFGLTETLLHLEGLTNPLTPVSTEAFPRPAQRPKNSQLDLTKWQNLNLPFSLSDWDIALKKYLGIQ
jgi:dTDP-4-dehydrorhamnose reductase